MRRSAAAVAAAVTTGHLFGCADSVPTPRKTCRAQLLSDTLPNVPLSATVMRGGGRVSCLALSTQHFPKTGGKIDVAQARRIIESAIRHGVTLFSTVWNDGDGERLFGEILSGETGRICRATSMPTWEIKTLSDAEHVLGRQLDGMKGCIEFYGLQALSSKEKFEHTYLQTGILDYLRRQKSEGRIRWLGVEVVGSDAFARDMARAGGWDFMSLPYNAVDDIRQEGNRRRLVEEIAGYGIAVMLTNPTKDGQLRAVAGDAADTLFGAYPERPAVTWALRSALAIEGVAAVCDDPAGLQELYEDLDTFRYGRHFDGMETDVWRRALLALVNNTKIRCTDCNRCEPCPYGIAISDVFALYNDIWQKDMLPDLYGDLGSDAFIRKGIYMLNRYRRSIGRRNGAFHCIRCNRCIPECPERIAIPQQMERIASILEAVRDMQTERLCGY